MPLHHQLIAIIVTLIWGTNFVFIELGLEELPPFAFAALRFAFVAFPLIYFLPRPKVSWWALASYGVLIGFGQFGLLFWVMGEHISPGLASLVIQLQALFTIFLALFIFKERVKPLQIVALAISFAGLALIVAQRSEQSSDSASLLGLMIILLAAISWAAGNLVVKAVGKVPIVHFLAWSSLFAVPPLLLMSYYFEGWPLITSSINQASWRAWAIVLWQTIGNTLIGYGLWNMLLNRHPAALITPWALLVPVFGMSASGLFLGESMPWWKLLAAGLIISGLLINLRATSPKKPV